MKKTHWFFVIAALVLSIGLPAEYVAQKNQRNRTTPVTSTLLDIGTDNTTYRLHSLERGRRRGQLSRVSTAARTSLLYSTSLDGSHNEEAYEIALEVRATLT